MGDMGFAKKGGAEAPPSESHIQSALEHGMRDSFRVEEVVAVLLDVGHERYRGAEAHLVRARVAPEHLDLSSLRRVVLVDGSHEAQARTLRLPHPAVPAVAGLRGELVEVPIRAEGIRVTKSLAWRADNDNPLIPLFLEMVKR